MLDNVKFHGIDLYYDEDCDDYVQYIFAINKDAITEMNQLLTENGWPGNLDKSFDLFCQAQQNEILSQLKVDSLTELQPVLGYCHDAEGSAPYFQFGFINPDHTEYGVVTASLDNCIFIPGHDAFDVSEDHEWEIKDAPIEQLLDEESRNDPYQHWFSVPLAFENAIEAKIREKTGLNAVQLGTLVFADVGEVYYEYDAAGFYVDKDGLALIHQYSDSVNPENLCTELDGFKMIDYHNEEANKFPAEIDFIPIEWPDEPER